MKFSMETQGEVRLIGLSECKGRQLFIEQFDSYHLQVTFQAHFRILQRRMPKIDESEYSNFYIIEHKLHLSSLLSLVILHWSFVSKLILFEPGSLSFLIYTYFYQKVFLKRRKSAYSFVVSVAKFDFLIIIFKSSNLLLHNYKVGCCPLTASANFRVS